MGRLVPILSVLIALGGASCAALRPPPPVDFVDLPCEPGYESSALEKPKDRPLAPELQRVAGTKLCTANPEFCKTNADCQKNYECNFHTQSFVPAGSGVCWPNVDAVLGS
jgi:hypothetical protein